MVATLAKLHFGYNILGFREIFCYFWKKNYEFWIFLVIFWTFCLTSHPWILRNFGATDVAEAPPDYPFPEVSPYTESTWRKVGALVPGRWRTLLLRWQSIHVKLHCVYIHCLMLSCVYTRCLVSHTDQVALYFRGLLSIRGRLVKVPSKRSL